MNDAKKLKQRQWETFRAELAKSFSILETTEDFEEYRRIIARALDASHVNADLPEKDRFSIAHSIASMSYLVMLRRRAKKPPSEPQLN